MAKPKAAEPEGQKENSKSFDVTLKLRHAEFIERMAAQRGETPARTIEYCVRQIYARDPYKAGAVSPQGSAPLVDRPPTGKAA